MRASGGTLGGASKIYNAIIGTDELSAQGRRKGGVSRPDAMISTPVSTPATAAATPTPVASKADAGASESKEGEGTPAMTGGGEESKSPGAADEQVATPVLTPALGETERAVLAADAEGEGGFAEVGPAEEDAPLPDVHADEGIASEIMAKTSAGYSLEEEKQHAELDAKMAAAEKAKNE